MRREIYWKGKRESSLWKMLRNYEDCIRKAGYLIQKYEQLEVHTEELLQIYERTIREYEESEEIFQKKENTWNEMMQLHLDEEELLQKKLRSCVDYMKESLGVTMEWSLFFPERDDFKH